MSFFGFKSKKEVEAEKLEAARKAAENAAQKTREDIELNNRSNLNNIGRGSTLNFTIPYFDVFDPRYTDQGAPVAVDGRIAYCINDMNAFRQKNKEESYNERVFADKLKSQLTKFVKSVIANAPTDNQIPVVQLERKIAEISVLIQNLVAPQLEQLFAINVRNIDIINIRIDKTSRGYRELKALSSDLEKDRVKAQNEFSISSWKQQQEMELEMQRMKTVETMRMQMDHQREMMRLQREGIEAGQQAMIEEAQENGRVSKLFGGNSMFGGMQGASTMFGGMGQTTPPPMGGMTPPPMQQVAPFYAFINGQQSGPFDMSALSQLVQQGQITGQTQVWTQGMPQWAAASTVPALAVLFAPASGATPPPMGGGSGPLPTPTL